MIIYINDEYIYFKGSRSTVLPMANRIVKEGVIVDYNYFYYLMQKGIEIAGGRSITIYPDFEILCRTVEIPKLSHEDLQAYLDHEVKRIFNFDTSAYSYIYASYDHGEKQILRISLLSEITISHIKKAMEKLGITRYSIESPYNLFRENTLVLGLKNITLYEEGLQSVEFKDIDLKILLNEIGIDNLNLQKENILFKYRSNYLDLARKVLMYLKQRGIKSLVLHSFFNHPLKSEVENLLKAGEIYIDKSSPFREKQKSRSIKFNPLLLIPIILVVVNILLFTHFNSKKEATLAEFNTKKIQVKELQNKLDSLNPKELDKKLEEQVRKSELAKEKARKDSLFKEYEEIFNLLNGEDSRFLVTEYIFNDIGISIRGIVKKLEDMEYLKELLKDYNITEDTTRQDEYYEFYIEVQDGHREDIK